MCILTVPYRSSKAKLDAINKHAIIQRIDKKSPTTNSCLVFLPQKLMLAFSEPEPLVPSNSEKTKTLRKVKKKVNQVELVGSNSIAQEQSIPIEMAIDSVQQDSIDSHSKYDKLKNEYHLLRETAVRDAEQNFNKYKSVADKRLQCECLFF